MKAIRNFIYNFSDIFIALMIIGLAAFLIWTRIGVIMDYPDSYNSNNIVAKVSDKIAAVISDFKGEDANTEANADANGVVDTDTTTDPTAEYVEIVIPQGSSTDVVASVLKQYGLVVNTNDFTYQVRSMGLEGQVMAGTFNIPRGCSMSDMINILCGKEVSSTPPATDAGDSANTTTPTDSGV